MCQRTPSVYKALLAIEGENGIYECEAIEHEGQNWLVPQWLENPAEGWRTPERLVSLTGIPHQPPDPPGLPHFVVNEPIPKSVLDDPGPLPPGSKYVVRHWPGVRFPIPRGIH
jgi:hypothetical protein